MIKSILFFIVVALAIAAAHDVIKRSTSEERTQVLKVAAYATAVSAIAVSLIAAFVAVF